MAELQRYSLQAELVKLGMQETMHYFIGPSNTGEYYRRDNVDAELLKHSEEERALRRLLAFAYSGHYLYGDDGELQDNRFPPIDFVRDSVKDIENKIMQRGMDVLAARQAQCIHTFNEHGHCSQCFAPKSTEKQS